MPTCAAKDCTNRQRIGIKLHRFPRDANRSQLWVDVCCEEGFKPTNSSFLCEEHFDEEQYECNRLDGRKLLKWNAIPTIASTRQVSNSSLSPAPKRRKFIPQSIYVSEDFQCCKPVTNPLKCASQQFADLNQTTGNDDPVEQQSTGMTAMPQVRLLGLVEHDLPVVRRQLSSICTVVPPPLLQLTTTTTQQFADKTQIHGNQQPSSVSIASQTPSTLSSLSPRRTALRHRLAVHRVINSRLRCQRKMWRQKCRQLKRQINRMNSGNADLQNILSVTQKLLSADGQALFCTQLKLASVRAKGRRYSYEMKNLALSLHYRGAKAYHFLSSIFTLPSKSSLHLWLQRINVSPGLCGNVWDVLKLRVDTLSSRDRVCALLFDEMALKQNLTYNRHDDIVVGYEDIGDGKRCERLATSALVFMVRGLAYNWKQPLGYILTNSTAKSEDVKSLLFECIERLQAIGLHVVVVISDQGPNFQQLVRNLGVTSDKPYFENNRFKYYYMYDPPHLLKSIRNNLQKYSFVFDGSKTACWADIKSFFNLDQQQRFRLAPRLTSKHIELPAFTKMKVKLAAQVLSRSVASGLETHALLKSGQGSDTAEFVAVFDELFDSLNSSQRSCIKKFKCAVTSNSDHLLLFQQRLEWFKSLKVLDNNGKDVTGLIKCISGWQLTLSSVINLWHHLNVDFNFEFLLTRRLNQDSLENFFSVIRQRGGSCVNPTSLTFGRLFRQVCCNTLFQPVAGANCELDCAAVLATLNSSAKSSVPMPSSTATLTEDKRVDQLVDLTLTCTDENELDDNGLSYVCGFFVRRLLKWHSCSICESVLVSKDSFLDDARNVYTNCRLYGPDELKGGKGLVFVSSEFFAYIQQLEETFDVCYKQHSYAVGISRLIVDELMHHPLPVFCLQFPKLQFLRYFVRVRIYYKLKFANVNEKKTTACSKSRKLKNLKHN